MEILIVVLVLAMLLFAIWMRRLQIALAAIDVSLGQIANALSDSDATTNEPE
jgi:hypothetical protein